MGLFERYFGTSKPESYKKSLKGYYYRYPWTNDQPCQIDCRVSSCKFNNGSGICHNISPAITLNENGKFSCWSQETV